VQAGQAFQFNPRARRCFAPAAFTLIELLTVIAIIGLLAALILTALARAKSQARATQCLSNLRQWGLAFRMYANDNGDYLPRRGHGVQPLAQIDRPEDWFNALPQYFHQPSFQQMIADAAAPDAGSASVFICPAAVNPGGAYFLPYGMNMNLCPWNLPLPVKYANIAQPDAVVAQADAPGPYASTYPSARPYGAVARHAGRINVLFLAGETKSFAGAYAGCGTGDPKRSDARWLTGTLSDAGAANY